MILGFFRNFFLVLVCFAAAPVSAATTSYLLTIDPLISSSNVSGGFAGFNQNFTLSGTFNAHITDDVTIQFENIDVVGTALDSSNNQYPPGTVVKFTNFPTFPGDFNSISFGGSIVIDNIQQSYTGTFDGKKLAMKGQVLPISGADFFTTVYSLNAAVATPTPFPPLSVGDVSITTLQDTMAFWTPVAIDLTMTPMAPTCRIVNTPANGTATVDEYCRSGTYMPAPGFIGNDAFTYQAAKGSMVSNIGTVSVAVSEGSVDQVCVQNNPVFQFSQTGKQGTLTITFTGNITSHTNKEVKVCPGTTLSYMTTSTQGSVICKVKNNTTRGSGNLKINDHIKCTDKPAGKDKVHFKVKSGVK
ncbi:MAG: Ig-like domain-containing protein [Sulfuricaulis sp.]|nr:Ig-like domain-containing protein [Sulfuricaulis sp.]